MNIAASIKDHLEKGLPFVAYRKPNEKKIIGFFQRTDTLYKTTTFDESGFIFAPFDDANPAILLPESEADIISEDCNTATEASKGYVEMLDESAKEKHLNLVSKTIEKIQKTGIQKIVISRKEALYLEHADLGNIFFRLLEMYDTAMVYIWFHPSIGLWIGASPETLVKLSDRSFSTMSLASTRPYENTLDVSWNPKELEEQSLVTDFIASQLDEVSESYTVHRKETVRAGNVVHLRTLLTGKIKGEKQRLGQLVKALHPTPAVCGMPRNEAKEFILLEEGYNRGFYTGFLGELLMQNKSELFVNLRCMEVKDSKAFLYVGGGITAQSIPEEEWKETQLKTKTLKQIL